MEKQNNIRAIWLRLFALLAVFTGLAGCSEDEDKTNVSPEISLNKTNLVLEVGSSERLTASFNPPEAPNKGHTWTSSAANVATVDETGMVTAVAVGNAVITAQALDGGKMASCNVQVVGEVVHVTGITLTPTNGDIAVGEQLQLTATVLPASATDQSVTWTSSNDAVATVDGTGKATGISAGSVVITATSNDGNKKATCQLTVREEGSEPVEIKTHFTPLNVYSSQVFMISENPNGITSVEVCYSKEPNPTITDYVATAEMREDGKLRLHLENLTEGTTYYIRTYNMDGNGVSYNDDEVSVQTVGSSNCDFAVTLTKTRHELYNLPDLTWIERYRVYWIVDYDIKVPGTYEVKAITGYASKNSSYNGEAFYIEDGTGKFNYMRESGREDYEGRNTYIVFGGTDYIRFSNLETGTNYYYTTPSRIYLPIIY